MDDAAVTVQPLVPASGERDFCEVFLDGVVVPDDRPVGQPGDGWASATDTVAFERGPTEVGFGSRYVARCGQLQEAVADGRLPASEGQRTALARCRVETGVLRLHVLRALCERSDGEAPGAAGSVGKSLATRVERLLNHVGVDLHGADALLVGAPRVWSEHLGSRARSIAGGTSQIQRTIVAERLLGLPRHR